MLCSLMNTPSNAPLLQLPSFQSLPHTCFPAVRNPHKTHHFHALQKTTGVYGFPSQNGNQGMKNLLRAHRSGRRLFGAQQIHQNLVQLRFHLSTVMRIRNVAHRNLGPTDRRPHVDRRLRRQTAHICGLGLALPLALRLLPAFGRCLNDLFLHRIDNRIRIVSGRQHHRQFVPKPLPRRRKIEVVPFDRVAVRERHAAPSWMPRVRPVSRLEQHRMKHSQLDDFAGHAVDLNPITQSDSIPAHQHKPAKESDDEILQRDGQARARESKKSCEIWWWPKNHEQNENQADSLKHHACYGAQGFDLAPVQLGSRQQARDPLIEKQSQQQNAENDRDSAQRSIQNRLLLRLYEIDPLVIKAVEFLFVVDPLVESGEFFLSRRAIFRRVDDSVRVVVAPRQPRRRGQRRAVRAYSSLRFVDIKFLLERVVPSRKRSDCVCGRRFRAPQQHLLLVQFPPLHRAKNESNALRRSRCGSKRRFGRFGGSLVLFDDRLDAVLRIAARAQQVPLRVIYFILLQFDLRVRDIELILQRVLLIASGLRNRRVELRDLRLRRRQPVLRLLHPRLDFLRFGAQWRRMQSRVAQCSRERDVHFMIRQPYGLFRQLPLARQRHQRSELLRNFQRCLIDDLWLSGRGLGAGFRCGRIRRHRRYRRPRAENPIRRRDQQQRQHYTRYLLKGFHGRRREVILLCMAIKDIPDVVPPV